MLPGFAAALSGPSALKTDGVGLTHHRPAAAYAGAMVCGACGRENAAGARFCDACGAPLTAVTPDAAARKVVTVLFTDVAGSTALGERLDPELLRRVMWRYFDTVQGVLEEHGGTVEKFIGDAVMAVFGVPSVREDDALRAVRAASELGGRLQGSMPSSRMRTGSAS